MKASITSQSPEATGHIGAQLAAVLRPGDVIGLRGELGAGKTTLVRAVVAGLGMDPSKVSSPTYVIANEYEEPGKPLVVHVDAYRLSGTDDLDSIGFERIIDGSAIVFIEWPHRIEDALPKTTAVVSITQLGETSRRLDIETPKSWNNRPGMLALATPPKVRRATLCPVTGIEVPHSSPTWPFANERARLSDLYQWLSGSVSLSRDIEDSDFDELG